MNVIIISGSPRADAQSLKVSNWLKNHAQTLEYSSQVVNLHEYKLPLFDVGETEAPQAKDILSKLDSADAVVLVSPEWNGMASHALINLMHYVGTELAHKPVMMVGVSAGRGGSYPLLQMRMLGYKNNHFVASPESLLVQDVNSVLNDTDMSEDADDYAVKSRADYGLKVLKQYADALKQVRESGVIDHGKFANGV